MDETTFGQRLVAARKVRGLSLHGLSMLVGHDKQTIWRWEKGRTPSADLIRGLAEALEVDFMWLAFGDGEGPVAAAEAV